MNKMPEAESSPNIQNAKPSVDPTEHLPLSLLRSESIPPAPTRSASTIDWLPEFAGYSWVAYGASSLLVIFHFPSPLSQEETLMGPIFRQVFELSDNSSPVTSVSWSPVTPSIGELAAASQNSIRVFAHDSASSKGSFCWSQNAILVQGTLVEAIEWTRSGDGIVVGGIEIVLWKKKNNLWEIAWKFKRNQPQNLVSATWSIEGPSATATCASARDIFGAEEVGKSVFVCYSDGEAEYAKVELCHPQPITMIQWRPATGRHSLGDTKWSWRHVLLTCCLDGTVRLWNEMDNGRPRKVGKDINDHKNMRRSFCVATVIEINQALNGILGTDIFLIWASEVRGMFKTSEGANQSICMGEYEDEKTGKCEWLVGFGPGSLVTLWAIHCLDDISPLRFPRVTLWKKQSLEIQDLHGTGFSSFQGQLLLNKVVFSRNCVSGPPTVCSFIHLSHYNSLIWSLVQAQTLKDVKDVLSNKSESVNLSCSASRILNVDGHTGKILQVSIHPYVSEVELAVSLDSNGLALIWLLSAISDCISPLPTLISSWNICGKLATENLQSKYTCLSWAPSILDEDRVLLLGHVDGIDCFIVKILQIGENVACHYICTIPLTSHGPNRKGPTNIFSLSLPSSNDKTILYTKFMLLGVWMKDFAALSWEITLYPFDLLESCCEYNIDDNKPVKYSMWFETTFLDKRYCVGVNPCSSQFPELLTHNHVTSFAVVCPASLMPIQQKLIYDDDLCSQIPAYTMATGFSDGSVKLWRSNLSRSSTSHAPWELVGMFVAHQGPVHAISLTDCGQKIATVSATSHLNVVSTLCIWESVRLTGSGSFILEDTLSFDGNIVAVNWCSLENGQFLLGVCLPNELQIYAQRRYGGQTLLNSKISLKMQNWFCLAFTHTSPATQDLFWGRGATAIVLHESYLSLYSQRLFLIDKRHQVKCHLYVFMDNLCCHNSENNKNIPSVVSTDCDSGGLKSLVEDQSGECEYASPVDINVKIDHLGASGLKWVSGFLLGFWSMLEMSERLRGSVPVYHPEALLMNIYSGNWKRAYVSVRHLVEYLTSNYVSEKRYCHEKSCQVVPQILLSTYFEGLPSKGSTDNGFQWSGVNTLMTSSLQFNTGFNQFAYNTEFSTSNLMSSSSPKSDLSGFVESLENLYELAGLTNVEKMQILAVIDLLNEFDNKHSASAYENLDEPGQRFWVALRLQQLHFFRRFGKVASAEELAVDSKLIGWAFHSDCQETLLGSVLPNEPSWAEMRALGVGYWFTNVTQLRTRMEKLARLQYLRKKDPKDCALLYIALNRIQVLSGLFKISKDEKDKPLVGFLSRNFQEEKNKAAALKNAYVLLGRHQLELAIAFFLLGGDAASAVTVCAKNLGDEQLALVICRLVEKQGGPLERNLIIKSILPSAIERGDYWLASLLEWELGNYPESFLIMLGFHLSTINKFALSSNHVAFMDPCIGLYCFALANKNSMKNAIGEKNAAILSRWATLMRVTALNRCGLPLDALDCFSSSPDTTGAADQGNVSDVGHSLFLPEILKPSTVSGSSNWLSGDVALHLESCAKLDLAVQYFSKLTKDHPSWPNLEFSIASTSSVDLEIHQYEKLLENFQQKLYSGLAHFEQRFSLKSSCLITKILMLLCNTGLLFIGCDILRGYICQGQSQDESKTVDSYLLYLLQHNPLLRTAEGTSIFLSRFIAASNITGFHSESLSIKHDVYHEVRSMWSNAWRYHFQCVIFSLRSLRAAIKIYCGSFTKDPITTLLFLLDLYDYYVHFVFAWLQRNSKALLLMVQPLLVTYTNGHSPYEVDMKNLKEIFHQITELVACNTSIGNVKVDLQGSKCVDDESRYLMDSIPEDERWQIIGVCLWQHMSRFMKHKLNSMSFRFDENQYSGFFGAYLSSVSSTSTNSKSTTISEIECMKLLALMLAKFLTSTLSHISSYHVKRLALFLQQKVENGCDNPSSRWLEALSASHSGAVHESLTQCVLSMDVMNTKDEVAISEILWDVCGDPHMISEGFAQEELNWPSYINYKASKGWHHVHEGVKMSHETEKTCGNEGTLSSTSASSEVGSPGKGLFWNSHTFLSFGHKDAKMANEVTLFQAPKEIFKRNGELFEALCINSIDQRQGAIASNRKGILFFNWEDGIHFRDQLEYIWSDADWPQNGWAGSESTPVPTFVSPGVGLGSKKGAHLGLGGATVGVGSLTRPGRDLTGGGAFSLPSYSGIEASGLGWGIQDDFEFVDPPSTVENISTRAFTSHPSRPFFLVGSSNTHIYLWEFGEDGATATYGVLPAANVPPPYALASISALQFDHCGHRFASAALDGTVCTWQLEVGGRSNVRPMESSLCFNSHATDVTYITSSGSVIAASGYSSNGVNVVVWDTLAPPTSSRASIMCHEGGARSISVFNNDIGSGSVSPLILTGGKGGDVGIHDFRYIATGRTKRHKHFDSSEPSSTTLLSTNMQTGAGNKPRDQNGMLWYIPKAHLGSVTRISTIPNTSLFLTGSKDGDVKLWDAKTAQLVYHWSKLHERHTFLQPSTRGFGGVVRAAVTDIQIVSHGFLSCGGDGSVKLVQLKD